MCKGICYAGRASTPSILIYWPRFEDPERAWPRKNNIPAEPYCSSTYIPLRQHGPERSYLNSTYIPFGWASRICFEEGCFGGVCPKGGFLGREVGPNQGPGGEPQLGPNYGPIRAQLGPNPRAKLGPNYLRLPQSQGQLYSGSTESHEFLLAQCHQRVWVSLGYSSGNRHLGWPLGDSSMPYTSQPSGQAKPENTGFTESHDFLFRKQHQKRFWGSSWGDPMREGCLVTVTRFDSSKPLGQF